MPPVLESKGTHLSLATPRNAPVPLPSMKSARGYANANQLVRMAEDMLKRKEMQLRQEHQAQEEKCSKAKNDLREALEVVEAGPTRDALKRLDEAVQAAALLGSVPELRVRARRILTSAKEEMERLEHAKQELVKATDRLRRFVASDEASRPATPQSDDEGDSHQAKAKSRAQAAIASTAAQRRQEVLLIERLLAAEAMAEKAGVAAEFCHEALVLIADVKQRREHEEAAARKLTRLLEATEPAMVDELLEAAKASGLAETSKETKRVIQQVRHRVAVLAGQEQNALWLHEEFFAAAEAQDSARLTQLVHQSKALGLPVSPDILCLLHELEAESRASTRAPRSVSEENKDGSSQDRSWQGFRERRQQAVQALEELAADAESTLEAAELDKFRQEVANAKLMRGFPPEALVTLEKRLTALEVRAVPRLSMETELKALLAEAMTAQTRGELLLLTGLKTDRLKTLCAEGKRQNLVDQGLLSNGVDLLEKIVSASAAQKEAAAQLRQAMFRPIRKQAEMERLQNAIGEARSVGLPTVQADAALLKAQQLMVQRAVAEAELAEASKGHGQQGRERLQAALQSAKNAGVAAERLRAASEKLAELQRHEQHCSLAAANIRRVMPMLATQPWRYQELVDMVKALNPVTKELQALLLEGQAKLTQAKEEQTRLRDAKGSLQEALAHIQECKTRNEPVGETPATLPKLLAEAKSAGVGEELLQQAQQVLRSIKHEACQRTAAEHQLKLALAARDAVEIERCVRLVRSLGHGQESFTKAATSNIMETANAVLREIADTEARRQAATAALQQRIAKDTRAEGTSKAVSLQALLAEAKQSGVAEVHLEQAKQKMREETRMQKEQAEACKELQKVLSKKDAAPQHILRSLHKVARLVPKSQEAEFGR